MSCIITGFASFHFLPPLLSPFLSAVLSVQFERPMYNVSEGGSETVTVVASNNFTSPFAVSISHNGPNGEFSQDTTVCMYGAIYADNICMNKHMHYKYWITEGCTVQS